jgi:L-ascorbate metabolism protein UlaG (beta-lactamase superfamily)
MPLAQNDELGAAYSWREALSELRSLPSSLRGGPGHRGPRSYHFDGERFFNPGAPAGKGWRDLLRWQRTRSPAPWPQWRPVPIECSLPANVGTDEVAVTFINHMTCLIRFAGLTLLTDPIYSQRASPLQWLGPRRVHAPGVRFEQLPRIDVVFVSHNHYDHMDLATLKRLARAQSPPPLFVTGLGNAAFLREHGITSAVELDWWGQAILPNAILMFTPAQHWSSRGLSGRNRTLWGGLWISVGRRTVYFSGDTGYSSLFGELRRARGSPDLALLPIGAYEPRWFMCDQHMNPDEAVRAHMELGARTSVGTHFGCFQLTDEAIDEPVAALDRARRQHGVDTFAFHAPQPGETLIWRADARVDVLA